MSPQAHAYRHWTDRTMDVEGPSCDAEASFSLARLVSRRHGFVGPRSSRSAGWLNRPVGICLNRDCTTNYGCRCLPSLFCPSDYRRGSSLIPSTTDQPGSGHVCSCEVLWRYIDTWLAMTGSIVRAPFGATAGRLGESKLVAAT